MITVYGIPNCSTVKKARAWLDAHAVAYRFHDYKKEGIGLEQLRAWAAELGWEALLNTRGTTWRSLADAERADLDPTRALALMQAKPSLIRRPLIGLGDGWLIGFDEAAYTRAFGVKGGAA